MQGLEIENLQNIVDYLKNQNFFPLKNLVLEFSLKEKDLNGLNEHVFMITNPLEKRKVETELKYSDIINISIQDINFRFVKEKKEETDSITV